MYFEYNKIFTLINRVPTLHKYPKRLLEIHTALNYYYMKMFVNETKQNIVKFICQRNFDILKWTDTILIKKYF